MSVAGGMARAVDRATLHGCEALQVFTRNPNRWHSNPLDPDDVRSFRQRLERAGIAPAVSHASYLINLGTASPPLRDASIAAFGDELDRAHALGLLGVVLHPGACTSGTEGDALRLVAQGIRAAFARRPRRRTLVLLEHTAGQGRSLGHTFEHLAAILSHLNGSPRVGVCLDTCHLLASGYDIVTPAGYAQTFAKCDSLLGLDRVKVFHANDSKKPLGSRVDRHEHIGDGCLGPEPFRRLLNDPRFAGRALLIETAKSLAHQRALPLVRDPLDERNLTTLRLLRDSPAASARIS
jgi:deoxyribonuclease-4